MKKYGGQYLVSGGNIRSIAGDLVPERMLVIKFDSFKALQKWHDSPEYAGIMPLRKRSTESRAIVADGL